MDTAGNNRQLGYPGRGTLEKLMGMLHGNEFVRVPMNYEQMLALEV
jgi:hypothetical protein